MTDSLKTQEDEQNFSPVQRKMMTPNKDETNVHCFHGSLVVSSAIVSRGELYHVDEIQSPATNTPNSQALYVMSNAFVVLRLPLEKSSIGRGSSSMR